MTRQHPHKTDDGLPVPDPQNTDTAGPLDSTPANAQLRTFLGVAANVTVLTALLIFIGWRRNETQSQELGLSESVFAASTQDYVLRSVRSAVIVLLTVGVAGIAWVLLDRWLVPLAAADSSKNPSQARHGRFTWTLRVLSIAWLLLPLTMIAIDAIWHPELMEVLFPLSIAVGILLLVYGSHLREMGRPLDQPTQRRRLVFHLSSALLVAVCVFWAAEEYAEMDGEALAESVDVTRLPGVTVHSQHRLNLDGPGAVERVLSDVEGEYRFEYSGLRLFVYSNDKYFLMSDGWAPGNGVVFVLPDDEAAIRVDFVRKTS